MHKVIAFDLDGTLARSKSPIDEEMASLLTALLSQYKVAVITGGSFKQLEKQFLPTLKALIEKQHSLHVKITQAEVWNNLFFLPACGAYFYTFNNDIGEWCSISSDKLSEDEKIKIKTAILNAMAQSGLEFNQCFGERIEDRGAQITFSALGQNAPIELKEDWDPKCIKRKQLIDLIEKEIPEFEIRYGGTTSIDITQKGIDKAFGINKLKDHLDIRNEDILYIGDRLRKGGNDFPVKQMGIKCYHVTSPFDTKEIIEQLLGLKVTDRHLSMRDLTSLLYATTIEDAQQNVSEAGRKHLEACKMCQMLVRRGRIGDAIAGYYRRVGPEEFIKTAGEIILPAVQSE